MSGLSLNQIEQTARKAVRGAGLSWGLAEDAGRAVRWLEAAGLPGMSWLADLLHRADHNQLAEWLIQPQSAEWHGASELISPLLAGPSLSDVLPLRLQQGLSQLTLRAVLVPQLCAGYLGLMSLQTGRPLALSWARGSVQICGARVWFIGAHEPDCDESSYDCIVHFRPRMRTTKENLLVTLAGSRQVEARVLDLLEPLVQQTYVKNTQASRLSGAGAGINDTD